jgi:hypothetical protein
MNCLLERGKRNVFSSFGVPPASRHPTCNKRRILGSHAFPEIAMSSAESAPSTTEVTPSMETVTRGDRWMLFALFFFLMLLAMATLVSDVRNYFR